MRFNRMQRYGPFEDNNRKRAALARKQRLERERFPLLAEVIAEQQLDADTIMAQRAVLAEQMELENRAKKAARWREARRRLFAYGDNIRPVLTKLWKTAPYPADPVYLMGMLHSYDQGRLDPDNPPWIYKGPSLKAYDHMAIINRARERMGKPPIKSFDELTQYGNPGTPAAPA